MKQDPEFFEGHEPELVYIAKRLKDALQIEEHFNTAGLDFGVETDTYQGGIIFRTERVGAFFYVLAGAATQARTVLLEHGFRPLAPEIALKTEPGP